MTPGLPTRPSSKDATPLPNATLHSKTSLTVDPSDMSNTPKSHHTACETPAVTKNHTLFFSFFQPGTEDQEQWGGCLSDGQKVLNSQSGMHTSFSLLDIENRNTLTSLSDIQIFLRFHLEPCLGPPAFSLHFYVSRVLRLSTPHSSPALFL